MNSGAPVRERTLARGACQKRSASTREIDSSKGHASVDPAKLFNFCKTNPIKNFGRRTTGLNEHQVGILSLRKFTTRFRRKQNCCSDIFISAKLLLMCFAGICRIFQAIQSCSGGVPYELARIFRGHGPRGDHRFGGHGPGDDQVSKWFRQCDAAFLQAGYPGDCPI
jgi:hypothetical protein